MSDQRSDPPRTADYFAWFASTPREDVRERLIAGCIVVANPYNGRVQVWKDASGYRVRVYQKRAIIQDERFDDPDAAMEAFWQAEATL